MTAPRAGPQPSWCDRSRRAGAAAPLPARSPSRSEGRCDGVRDPRNKPRASTTREDGMNHTDTERRPFVDTSEDEFTKNIERYTASIPSSAYLAVAVGAIGLSLIAQLSGKGKWGNFVAQWVPTWLLLGLYNKVVKTEGHDRYNRNPSVV